MKSLFRAMLVLFLFWPAFVVAVVFWTMKLSLYSGWSCGRDFVLDKIFKKLLEENK